MPNLNTRIMRRVYAIWMLRKATSPRVVKLLILLTAVWQIKDRVFVSKVIENMPSLADIQATYGFFSSAMMHTQLTVQLSIIASGLFALLLLRDFVNRKELTYWF
jgi:hypothetical protein